MPCLDLVLSVSACSFDVLAFPFDAVPSTKMAAPMIRRSVVGRCNARGLNSWNESCVGLRCDVQEEYEYDSNSSMASDA